MHINDKNISSSHHKKSFLLFNVHVFVLLFIFIFQSRSLKAQDLHFSQFYNSPLSTSPANTGFIPDADYRIGLHYRNQFSNIMYQPYKTTSLFSDVQLFRDRFENGWLGAGFLFLNDVAGKGTLQSTKLYASIAYHQMLGNSSLISGGFNVGWANKRIDPSKLTFPDQFDGEFFDNSLPTAVTLVNTSVGYPDIQVGLNYAYFPNDNIYFTGGYSIHHVNRPYEGFFGERSSSTRIPMRHIGFISGTIKLNSLFMLQPQIFYNNQSRASQLHAGLLTQINLGNDGENMFQVGAQYRVRDAWVAVAGFQISNIMFTFSFDATQSSLTTFNQSRGASEFSLIRKGFYPGNQDRQSLCPRF